jgi:predicted phosphodiesterase
MAFQIRMSEMQLYLLGHLGFREVLAEPRHNGRIEMRALIVSDIHANLQALESVLASAPKHDVVWNLGDVVDYGANPNEVIDEVRRLGGVVVRGNHDRACCGIIDARDFSELAREAVSWTRGVLTKENREWLWQLPAGPIKPAKEGVICVHGTPGDEDEYLVVAYNASGVFDQSPARTNFFGHTHQQTGFSKKGKVILRVKPEFKSRDDAERFEVHLSKGTRYVLDPGSVGQPRDGDWRAAFAVYDTTHRLLTGTGCPTK